AVPDDCKDIFDPKVWKKANPALGDFRSLEEFKVAAAEAKRMPSFENSFRNLYLNQRVDIASPLITRIEWLGCKTDGPTLVDGEDIYIGLDLSAKTDLTALVAVSATNGDRLGAWFWKPKENMELHERRDRAPYDRWEKEGHLFAVPGKTIDLEYVARKLVELSKKYNVLGVAYDRWRIDVLLKELSILQIEAFADEEWGEGLRLMSWGQGFKDMSPAIDTMEQAVLDRTLKHDGHPVLTWCFSNATDISDPSGNRKLDKQKARFRIDGAVATVMAMGLKARDMTDDIGGFLAAPIGVSA
ncbi:MAG: terminase TerL endonuclease subunit, partial [Sneathiella sp.]